MWIANPTVKVKAKTVSSSREEEEKVKLELDLGDFRDSLPPPLVAVVKRMQHTSNKEDVSGNMNHRPRCMCNFSHSLNNIYVLVKSFPSNLLLTYQQMRTYALSPFSGDTNSRLKKK